LSLSGLENIKSIFLHVVMERILKEETLTLEDGHNFLASGSSAQIIIISNIADSYKEYFPLMNNFQRAKKAVNIIIFLELQNFGLATAALG